MNKSGLTENWRKSTHSQHSGCVEARTESGFVQVRDSKKIPDSRLLSFHDRCWTAFVGAVCAGTISHLPVIGLFVAASFVAQLGWPGAVVAGTTDMMR